MFFFLFFFFRKNSLAIFFTELFIYEAKFMSWYTCIFPRIFTQNLLVCSKIIAKNNTEVSYNKKSINILLKKYNKNVKREE